MSLHPFAESTALAALANLDEAVATLQASMRTSSERGAWSLVMRALGQVGNARAKLADALTLEEMAEDEGVAE
jgi:hypothetical protein